jgi:hypothetical protein
MQLFAHMHAAPHTAAAAAAAATMQDSLGGTPPPPHAMMTAQGALGGAESPDSRQAVRRLMPQHGETTPPNSNAAARAGNFKWLSGGPSTLLQRQDDSYT